MIAAVAPVELRRAAPADVEAAVALHRCAIPYSLNSRLGAAHMAAAYRILLRDAGAAVAVAVRGGHIAGVVVAGLEPAALERRLLARLGPRGWLRMACGLALRPSPVLEALRASRPVIHQGRPVVPRLIAIAVDESGRQRGVGRALVGAVDDFVRGPYHLETRADNADARAFYARCGFVEVERRGPDIVLVKELP
jgi:ribosomal protein S18 acetylase RimI-like enzyme